MNHLEIYNILDETFGPLNPIVVEIKEALKLPEEFQELLEALWRREISFNFLIPISVIIKLLDENLNLSRQELATRFHVLTYLIFAAELNDDNINYDSDMIFKASTGPPLLVNPLNQKILFCP